MKYLSYFLYTIIFIIIWGLRPPISSDSLHGVLGSKPNVATSINPLQVNSKHSFHNLSNGTGFFKEKSAPVFYYKTEKDLYPIMLENKHGGGSLVLYKAFYGLFGEKYGFLIWHYLSGLLILFLLTRIINKLFNKKVASICSSMAALSPFLCFLYVFFISETLCLAIFLVVIDKLLNLKNDTKEYIYIGLLLSLGLYIRVNFLWLIIAAIPFLPKDIKVIRLMVLSGFLSSLPHIFLVDWNTFFSESLNYQMETDLAGNISFFLTSLVNSPLTFNFLWSEAYQAKMLGGLSYYLSDILSSTLLIAVTFFLIYSSKVNKNKYNVKIFISMVLFVISLLLSIKMKIDYSNYFYPLFVYQILILGVVLQKKSDKPKIKYFQVLLVVGILINLTRIYGSYLDKGPVTRHNLAITQKIVDEALSSNRTSFYTFGESDVGRYEYISNGKVAPIHLVKLVASGEIKTFVDGLDKLKKGSVVIPFKDEWAGWHWNWGPFEIERIKTISKHLGIEIFNEKIFYKNGEQAVWFFSFKKI